MRVLWHGITDARNHMPVVISVIGGSATAVGDLLHGVVRVVVPNRVLVLILLRDVLFLKTTVTVISHGCVLIRAAAFWASILANLRHLIPSVVGVDGG